MPAIASFHTAWTLSRHSGRPQLDTGSVLNAHGGRSVQSYVLWPDLQAAYFRARLTDVADNEVRAYLDRYGILKPARELRYRYALHLAREDRLAEYFDIYQQYYQGLELAAEPCREGVRRGCG